MAEAATASNKTRQRAFARDIVRAVFDGEIVADRAEFALGFAAAIDCISRVTINPDDPVGNVVLASRDVFRTPTMPAGRPWITPMMQEFYTAEAARHA